MLQTFTPINFVFAAQRLQFEERSSFVRAFNTFEIRTTETLQGRHAITCSSHPPQSVTVPGCVEYSGTKPMIGYPVPRSLGGEHIAPPNSVRVRKPTRNTDAYKAAMTRNKNQETQYKRKRKQASRHVMPVKLQ